MTRLAPPLRAVLLSLWRTDALLTSLALLMLPILLASAVGLWLDPRTVLGAPVWLKPAKFAASIAVYSLTLAWIFGQLPSHPRARRFVGRTTAVVMPLEMAIISVQAVRGVPSHFNVSTPLDAVLFSVMGAAIVLQTVTSLAVAVALWREKFTDPALAWALRLGMVITLVGASLGGAMTSPGQDQLSDLRAGRASLSGAHTVGAADGGPGLAVTGWSREHGDLRIPHFIGLHALQVLPLVALGLRRSRSSIAQRVRLVAVTAASYTGLLAISLWQALRGQALFSPDALTFAALGAWLGTSLALACLAHGHRGNIRPEDAATALPRQTPPLRSPI
jgi:uncharacterized MnhB-related membrane protein